MTTTAKRIFCMASVAPAVLVATVGLFGATSSPALAQTTPNFQSYCNANFPNSTYEVRYTQWGPQHFCRRPGPTGGFTLQNISVDDVCTSQTGSPTNYRKDTVVQCGTDPDPTPTNPQTPEEYQRYCRDNFPNSTYERRMTQWGVRHFCRRPDPTSMGYTLQEVRSGGGGGGGGGGGRDDDGGMQPQPLPRPVTGPVFAPTQMHLDPCGDGLEGRSYSKVKDFWKEVRDDVKDKYKDAIKDGMSVTEAEQHAARKAAKEAVEEDGNRWDAALAAAAAVRFHNGTLNASGMAAYNAIIARGGSQREATDAAAWTIQRLAQVPTSWTVRDIARPDRYCSRPPQVVQANLERQRQREQERKQRMEDAKYAAIMGFVLQGAIEDRRRHHQRHHSGYHD